MNRLLKKLLAYSLFSVLAVTALSATTFSGDLLSKPHRIFQVGVDSKVMIANNLFGVEDILTKILRLTSRKWQTAFQTMDLPSAFTSMSGFLWI